MSAWEFAGFVLVGFSAQVVDGALGMAYGVTATTLLISLGVPPAVASATVHLAECVTTGVSGLAHHAFGNVDRFLFRRLILPGTIGAATGAWVLATFESDLLRMLVASYLLLMGVVIVVKVFRRFPPRSVTTHLVPLGFVGGFLDAAGGGGWGPIVATNLMARGREARFAIGSTNAVEFFVATAASVSFVLTLGAIPWGAMAGLALGGALGAPVGAWICKRVPTRGLMIGVGLLIVALSLRTLLL